VVVLGVAILLSAVVAVVARPLRVAPPVLLLGCGVVVGFVPGLGRVYLPPSP
jgi:monovalent cation/hydrogen antiporter